jgi:hypothetical protein
MVTRVNIDQRPRLMQFAGGVLLMGALLYGTQSFLKDTSTLYQAARQQMRQQVGKFNDFGYIGSCVKSKACLGAYVSLWSRTTPPQEMAAYLTGVLTGSLFLLFGAAWKPEMAMLRATRMRSWREFKLPEKSVALPGRQA